jgi:MFS family permease
VFRDPRERQRAIALWAGCAGLGGALGPIATGVLLAHYDWPSTFFINVVICAVALVAGAFLLPNSSDPAETTFDPLGVLFAVGAVGLLLYGIIDGPSRGWSDPVTIAALLTGMALVVAFVLWERHNPRPMLDVRLFAVRPFQVGSTTITLQFFAMYGLYFAVAQYLQISHGYSPLRAAVACLPIGAVSMVSAWLSANMVRKYGNRVVVGSGLLLSAAGLAAMGWVTPTTTYLLLGAAFACMGFGGGQTNAPSTTLIMSSVPRAKSGVGSAVNDLSRELGGALGIAVLGSVLSSVYRSTVSAHAHSAALAAKAGSSVDVTLHASQQAFANHNPAVGQALLHIAQTTFAHAFGVAMLLGAAILVLNSALVWARSLRAGADGG